MNTSDPHHHSAWRIRAWDDTRLAERFLELGLVAVSEDDIGQDVTRFASEKALRRKILEENPGRSDQAIGTFVTYWRDFSRTMKTGDIIVLAYRDRRGTLRAAIGSVSGEYQYCADEPDLRLRHRRAVSWHITVNRNELDDDLRRAVNTPATINRFRATDAYSRLAAMASNSGEPHRVSS